MFLKMWLFLIAFFISFPLFAVPSMKIQFSGKASVRGVTPKDNSICLYLAIVNKAQTSTSWSNDGTSTSGGQPTSCVTVSTSTDGEFSVTLGDTSLTNMTALPESTFNTTTSDLYLSVWLQANHPSLGTFSVEQLTPNILLTSAPYSAGASTIPVGGPQILTVNTTAVGNVGTGEDDLMSYTLPASTLKNTGQVLKITAWGILAARQVSGSARCFFGSTAIVNNAALAIGGVTTNVQPWHVTAYVVRKSSTAQESTGYLTYWEANAATGKTLVDRRTPAETLSNTVVIKCAGEVANSVDTVANDDIQQMGLIVELLN